MEKIMLPLGRRLKELRKERKLKQKEMARVFGMYRPKLSENGVRRD